MTQKKMAEKYVKMAIAYDFDGTLTAGNMQQHSFIPMIKMEPADFWKEVKEVTRQNNMNEILAYMFLMLKKARENDIPITRREFMEHGKGIELFPGLPEYFDKINAYAKSKGLIIEHYIISSGLEDILKGTSVYSKFERVFASAFKYDVNNVAEWPAQAIDYTNKTQFLFRINKGIKNEWDNHTLNSPMPDDVRPIPFRRMLYIGDGETDIPAMKMTSYQGGKSIVVYNPNQRTNDGKRAKNAAQQLMKDGRADFIAAADYSEKSHLYEIITHCIDIIAGEAYLEQFKEH